MPLNNINKVYCKYFNAVKKTLCLQMLTLIIITIAINNSRLQAFNARGIANRLQRLVETISLVIRTFLALSIART